MDATRSWLSSLFQVDTVTPEPSHTLKIESIQSPIVSTSLTLGIVVLAFFLITTLIQISNTILKLPEREQRAKLESNGIHSTNPTDRECHDQHNKIGDLEEFVQTLKDTLKNEILERYQESARSASETSIQKFEIDARAAKIVDLEEQIRAHRQQSINYEILLSQKDSKIEELSWLILELPKSSNRSDLLNFDSRLGGTNPSRPTTSCKHDNFSRSAEVCQLY